MPLEAPRSGFSAQHGIHLGEQEGTSQAATISQNCTRVYTRFPFFSVFFLPLEKRHRLFRDHKRSADSGSPAVGSLQDGAGQGKEGDGVAFWVPSHRIVGGCHVP